MVLGAFVAACDEQKSHTAPAIYDRDSVSMMTSYGINTLISDSGVIKYKIVAERWDVNTVRHPSRWTFEKGIFMEQFDEQFHVEGYIQADTAWYYDQQKLWELRGRVYIRNVNGLVFRSEEFFWDGIRHEFYSHKFSRVVTPERTLEGRRIWRVIRGKTILARRLRHPPILLHRHLLSVKLPHVIRLLRNQYISHDKSNYRTAHNHAVLCLFLRYGDSFCVK